MPDRVPLVEDNVPLVEDKPAKEVKPKVQDEALTYMDDIEYHRVADHFNVDYETRKSPDMAQKLSYLYDWAGDETKGGDRLSRLEALKSLSDRLGLQIVGKELILKLYQYTRLASDKKRIEREMALIK